MEPLIGPRPLQGVSMPAWLLRFDEQGACTSSAMREALLDKMRTAPPTDVVLFSHGWNNDFDEAVGMYAEFLQRFEAHCARHAPGRRFDPLFVGVLWPSKWLPLDEGPDIASGVALDAQTQHLLGELAQRIAAAGGPAGVERLTMLLARPSIGDHEAAELAGLIAPAFGLMADEGAAAQGRSAVADDVLAMMKAMEVARPARRAPEAGVDEIEAPRRPARGQSRAPAQAQVAGTVGGLDPLMALRLFSLYVMKDRAGAVGHHGVAALLGDLLRVPAPAAADGPARIHVVGHSFGCKVLLSAICAQPLSRPVASALLLQPAVSHLCFADEVPGSGLPGGYRAALGPDRVTAPIFITYSRRDFPLHRTFHLAVRREADLGEARIAADPEATTAGAPPSRYAALGGYGPRRAGQMLVDPLPPAGSAFPMPGPEVRIVAFDGSTGPITGHGAVTGTEVAWALHRLVFR